MTTPAQNVATAKQYVGYAEKGASKLAELAKASRKLEDAGKTLSEVDAVLTKLVFMSKIAVGLQVVSVGLSVVQAFLPVKSKEDLILDAVQQVGRDVLNLKDVVNLQFNTMSDKVLDASSRQALQNQISIIRTAHSILETMAFNRKNGKSTALQESELQKVDVLALRNAVSLIQDYCTGTVLVPNILQISYNQTWGDVDEVLRLGTYLLQYAHMAAATHVAVEVCQKRASNAAFTDADAFALAEAVAGDERDTGSYQARLKVIANQVHDWGQKCIDTKTRYGLIHTYFPYYVTLNPKTLDVTDLSGTAKSLQSAYKAKWPLLNFTVMAYKNLNGYAEHGMKYSGPADDRILSFLHYPDHKGELMNIVIYMAKRTSKTLPRTMSYGQATRGGDKKRRNAINGLSSQLNTKHQFGFSYWFERKLDNVLDLSSYYGVMTNPSHPDNWSGDFLWIGWNDDGWPINSRNTKPLVGLASDNPVLVKRATRKKTGRVDENKTEEYLAYEGYDVLVIHDDAH